MTVLLSNDTAAETSNVLGWLSIGCWIIVYSPQIYENYSRKSGEGLSVAFVITWLLGDLFSLAGAIIAGLIPTVILLACYYAVCDMTLLFQIYYYRIFYSAHLEKDSLSEHTPLLDDPDPSKVPVETRSPPTLRRQILEIVLLWALVLAFGLGAFFYDKHGPRPSPQPDAPSREDIFEWKSQVMGWLSAALYLGSRIPQIKKNVETRCEGLSLELFMFAIGGNVFYVLSICVLGLDPKHLATNASWLAGSGLTVFLDFFVLAQFFHYRSQDRQTPMIHVTEPEE